MHKKKDWTIMVYMSGDNNLSVDMAYALENIKAVASESSKEVEYSGLFRWLFALDSNSVLRFHEF